MNYYFFVSAALYYSVSVICDYLFTVYDEFAKFLFTMRYFEQIKSDMCGCEWLKISGRYSWYQSFGSRQSLAYIVNLFTESLSFELESLPF